MESNTFSSKRLEAAISQFAKLPGIGKKTALRLVLHLLKQEKEKVLQFTEAIQLLREEVKYCKECNNISDDVLCQMCSNPMRNAAVLCVVEDIKDVISIEATGQFHGLYHVLGGLIAPLDGVGPEQLSLDLLLQRCERGEVQEIIMAISPTIEGDTTVFYIAKMLRQFPLIKITSIARGVAFGGELEYTDELTLGKSIHKRLPIDNYINTQ